MVRIGILAAAAAMAIPLLANPVVHADSEPTTMPADGRAPEDNSQSKFNMRFDVKHVPPTAIDGRGEFTVRVNGKDVKVETEGLPDASIVQSLEGKLHDLQVIMEPTMVKAAYAGIGVGPADATLRAQLKLPEGVGLVVRSIEADGPGKTAGIHQYDVITRLDDQIIIDAQQFAVLIRMHKPGDTIELTVIREAQPIKVSVKLVEHEVPELSWILSRMDAKDGGGDSRANWRMNGDAAPPQFLWPLNPPSSTVHIDGGTGTPPPFQPQLNPNPPTTSPSE